MSKLNTRVVAFLLIPFLITNFALSDIVFVSSFTAAAIGGTVTKVFTSQALAPILEATPSIEMPPPIETLQSAAELSRGDVQSLADSAAVSSVKAALQSAHDMTRQTSDEIMALQGLATFGAAGIVQGVALRHRASGQTLLLLGREASGMGRAAVAFKLLSQEFTGLSRPENWELVTHWKAFFVFVNNREDQLYIIQHPMREDKGLAYYDVESMPTGELVAVWKDTTFYPSSKPVHVDRIVLLDRDSNLTETQVIPVAANDFQRDHLTQEIMDSFFGMAPYAKRQIERALSTGSLPMTYVGRVHKLDPGPVFDQIVARILVLQQFKPAAPAVLPITEMNVIPQRNSHWADSIEVIIEVAWTMMSYVTDGITIMAKKTWMPRSLKVRLIIPLVLYFEELLEIRDHARGAKFTGPFGDNDDKLSKLKLMGEADREMVFDNFNEAVLLSHDLDVFIRMMAINAVEIMATRVEPLLRKDALALIAWHLQFDDHPLVKWRAASALRRMLGAG